MKELQKYYAWASEIHEYSENCLNGCNAVYLASEADAAFAERDQALEDRENTILHLREELSCAGITTEYQHKEIQRLKREHAEEIERLKHQHKQEMGCAGAAILDLRLQAERYEKLRRLNSWEFTELSIQHRGTKAFFDALVDQLPGSGEASADRIGPKDTE